MSFLGKKKQDEVEAARQMAIKLTLSKEMASSIKKLQRDHISTDSAIRSGDTANRFCNVMEAILLHELKESYSSKTFWPFLIKFTHRDVLDQIKSLSFVKTEIGYCRAWVRLSLNDCLMESYVAAILRDSKTIRQYYSRKSFLRDPEQPFIIRNYLQGLSNFSFQLSFNSTLLNVWGAAPSMLKGSWSPPDERLSTDTSSPGAKSNMESSSRDWPITTGALTSADMGFPIAEASLQATPSSSVGTPQREPSSFLESELSSNLLRSLEEEEEEEKEGGGKAGTGDVTSSRNSRSDVDNDPTVIVEDSEDFEDSVVIHLSPSHPSSSPEAERPADPSAPKHLDFGQSDSHSKRSYDSNPYSSKDSDMDVYTLPNKEFSNGLEARSDMPSGSKPCDPTPVVDGRDEGTTIKRSLEKGDELNPFLEDSECFDDMSEHNSKKPMIPSPMEELDSAGEEPHEDDNIDAGCRGNREDRDDDRMVEEVKPGRKNAREVTDGRSQDSENHEPTGDAEKEKEFTSSFGNSLGAHRGWSSDFLNSNRPVSMTTGDATDGNTKQESYQSVLKNYMDMAEGSVSPISNYTPETSNCSEGASVGQSTSPRSKSHSSSSPPPTDLPLDFEIIALSSSPVSKYADTRTQELLEKVMTIANEKGLDSQNYQCKGCTRPVGIIYGKAKVCGYDGCYYCYECHVDEESVIPARVLHSWDFRKQKVAKHTKGFLQQIEAMPLIDVAENNPSLYKAVPELEEVRKVRMQLKYLKAYLFTCKQSVAEELKKRVWPREYMLDHVHCYSMLDFSQVEAGTLPPILKKVVVFAVKHVRQCALCSQKGFICEICENSKIIYPFDMDLTTQCSRCKAVYHRACKTELKPCPKCVRRKVRRNQSHQTTSKEDGFVSPFN